MKTLLIILLFAAIPLLADVTIDMKPRQAIVGEPVNYIISSTEGSIPKLENLPDVPGIKWSKNPPSTTRSVTIVNMRKETANTATYSFTVTATGEYTLPEMSIDAGDKKYKTEPMKITASERKYNVKQPNGNVAEAKLENLLFQKVTVDGDSREFYVGEEISMEVKVFIAGSLQAQLRTWPQPELEKVIFHDYSNVNEKNRNFTQPFESRTTIDKQDFGVITFNTKFRPLSPGKLTGKINTETIVLVPNNQQNNDDDSPMGGFFSRVSARQVPRMLSTELEPLNILPLPPLPQDCNFLGLVGNWDVRTKLTPQKFKVGDTATLTIKIDGIGSLDLLTPPPLELQGFRIYPPEIDKKPDYELGRSSAEIRYLMIPTEPGTKEITFIPSVFLCYQKAYRKFEFKQNITVEKSDALTSNEEVFVSNQPLSTTTANTGNSTIKPQTGILYMKRNATGGISLPLIDNYLIYYIILALGGPLLLLITEFIRRRKINHNSNPALQRRYAAVNRKTTIVKKLKNAAPQDIDTVIQQDVVSFINDMMSLPPGTSASELVNHVEDNEMKECLQHAGTSSYMPGSIKIDSEELRRKIIKAIQRVSLIALLFTAGINLQAATTPPTKTTEVKTATEALTAYDLGQFKAAAGYYAKQLDPHAPDPSQLFNLADCLLQQKKYAQALACYETASRLAPGDSDIEENLDFTRSRMLLQTTSSPNHPLELLKSGRDRLRPDQWLLGVGAAWFMFFIILAGRRKLHSYIWGYLGATLMAGGLCLAAAISQYQTTYAPGQAIIIGKAVPVFNLPSENSGYAELKLQNGQSIKIEEERPDWLRIKADQSEGWIHTADAAVIWGHRDSQEWEKLCR